MTQSTNNMIKRNQTILSFFLHTSSVSNAWKELADLNSASGSHTLMSNNIELSYLLTDRNVS